MKTFKVRFIKTIHGHISFKAKNQQDAEMRFKEGNYRGKEVEDRNEYVYDDKVKEVE